MTENKYENGKVYGMECQELKYYGSTIKELKKRYSLHKWAYNSRLLTGKHYTTSFQLFERSDQTGEPVTIFLLESVSCESRNELERIENSYIALGDSVNKHRSGMGSMSSPERTRDYRRELYADNVERYKEYSKKGYNRSQKEKCNCDCGGVYTSKTRLRHSRTKMHLKFLNEI